jgi:hypothetical protein
VHGDKDWVAAASLISSRTKIQCHNRWRDVFDPTINRSSGRRGEWGKDEDIQLKGTIHAHGEKGWVAIAAMVSGHRMASAGTDGRNYRRGLFRSRILAPSGRR